MKYNFDEVFDRTGTNSEKWNVKPGELPMWVADMDFQAAPAIREAINRRVAHGIMGYSYIPDEWYDAYINWWENRHNFKMKKSWLMYSIGVIPSFSSIIRCLTTPGENVVVLSPVYNHFFYGIEENDRIALESQLLYDGSSYSIDWPDLEEKFSRDTTNLFIFCNPQNPGGILWDKDTIVRIGELAEKHNVYVISDEIHCDLVDPGLSYIPYASASEICKNNSITLIAPTKCFNIAGLKTSAVVVPNPELWKTVRHAIGKDEINDPNAFAVDAVLAAFNESGDWLDELNQYIYNNKQIVIDYINNNIPSIKVVPSQATYLLWLDCSSLTSDSKLFSNDIRNKTGLFVSNGSQYRGDGSKFLRFNIACPKSTLMDGLERLNKAINL